MVCSVLFDIYKCDVFKCLDVCGVFVVVECSLLLLSGRSIREVGWFVEWCGLFWCVKF